MNQKKLDNIQENQKRYYNAIADTYDEHHANPHAIRYRYELCENLLKGIDIKGFNVLDAMCGGGPSTRFFLDRGATVTGLDISDECCRIYQKRYPNNEVVCDSLTQTSFPNDHFDMVYTDSLHHLHPRVEDGMDEVLRVLKPGGYFIIFEPAAGTIPDFFRKIWYKCDKKFFEKNEESIDLNKLSDCYADRLNIVKKQYGGNFAYLFIFNSLIWRIPSSWIRYFAPAFLSMERAINIIQPRILAFWVLVLFKKR